MYDAHTPHHIRRRTSVGGVVPAGNGTCRLGKEMSDISREKDTRAPEHCVKTKGVFWAGVKGSNASIKVLLGNDAYMEVDLDRLKPTTEEG